VADTQYTSTGIAEALAARLGLKAKVDTARMIRHYTSSGLLKTVGAVHTGTGRKRVYSEDAVLQAGVLLRLNRLGVPVGVVKEMLAQLRRNLAVRHGNKTLLEVSRAMEDPCLFLVIPDENGSGLQTKILERKKFDEAPAGIDAVVISLAKFLK
jgi:DNA-binding transcriptional MerR regulator